MSPHADDLPPELEQLGERLRDERPSLDALAYDRTQQRVRRMAGRAPRRPRRSSLAVALCLGVGAVLGSGGAGLAVSGLASTDSTAVQAQYQTAPVAGTTTSGTTETAPATTPTSSYTATTPTTTTVATAPATTPTSSYTATTPATTTTVATTPTTETIGAVTTTTTSGGGARPRPTVAGVSTSSPSPAQASAQVGATQSASTLPFTGFAAIPVMLAGLALLIAGIVLRRRRAGDV